MAYIEGKPRLPAVCWPQPSRECMLAKMFFPLRAPFQTLVWLVLASGWLCWAAVAQTTSSQPQSGPGSQVPAVAPAQTVLANPKQPETQPSLLVDRDPVLSPDYEDDQPVSASRPLSQQRAREIQHLRGNEYMIRRNVDEVVLNCTVVDKKGRLVTDLTRQDFHVWEDNKPQVIASFSHEDLPVSMGILVDNSGSMQNKLNAVDKAALDLVRASNPDDEAFIVNFSDQAYLDQGFTSSIAKLEQGLAHTEARGGTALYDAIVASADELSKDARHPKQVLLVVTDGEDDASTMNLQQAIQRVQALHGPEIYAIGLLYDDSGDEAHRARKALEQLTEQTGGLAYFPRSLENVDEVAAEVAKDIRNQYTIGYHPTRPVRLGGYRTVRVEAKAPGHGRLIVRTRTGYLATPNAKR
ncbi:von Willebrand factor type A domain protein [Acidobacterium capsulatum ATCC 51196]|uniref:von Willebrand factor type A domain protein n=2 Tax=Acidobacteriaceae TaxID=204434 RepID=C1F3L6_ACIC5|nr:von Willebrand factor type A domain protein [Acidobacterium capsulatum ATCC 51196]